MQSSLHSSRLGRALCLHLLAGPAILGSNLVLAGPTDASAAQIRDALVSYLHQSLGDVPGQPVVIGLRWVMDGTGSWGAHEEDLKDQLLGEFRADAARGAPWLQVVDLATTEDSPPPLPSAGTLDEQKARDLIGRAHLAMVAAELTVQAERTLIARDGSPALQYRLSANLQLATTSKLETWTGEWLVPWQEDWTNREHRESPGTSSESPWPVWVQTRSWGRQQEALAEADRLAQQVFHQRLSIWLGQASHASSPPWPLERVVDLVERDSDGAWRVTTLQRPSEKARRQIWTTQLIDELLERARAWSAIGEWTVARPRLDLIETMLSESALSSGELPVPAGLLLRVAQQHEQMGDLSRARNYYQLLLQRSLERGERQQVEHRLAQIQLGPNELRNSQYLRWLAGRRIAVVGLVRLDNGTIEEWTDAQEQLTRRVEQAKGRVERVAPLLKAHWEEVLRGGRTAELIAAQVDLLNLDGCWLMTAEGTFAERQNPRAIGGVELLFNGRMAVGLFLENSAPRIYPYEGPSGWSPLGPKIAIAAAIPNLIEAWERLHLNDLED